MIDLILKSGDKGATRGAFTLCVCFFFKPELFEFSFVVVDANVLLNGVGMHRLLLWVQVPSGTCDEYCYRNIQHSQGTGCSA